MLFNLLDNWPAMAKKIPKKSLRDHFYLLVKD